MNEAPMSQPRFVLMDEPPKGYDPCDGTNWWHDTWRPLSDEDEAEAGHRYVAVQTQADKDANNYQRIEGEMELLFTDEAEYYVVCGKCYCVYRGLQWSGSTRGWRGWREEAERERQDHQRHKGWCEFCDPIFGNGGWRL